MATENDTVGSSGWRPVVGFEGLYEITVDGRVRTVTREVVDSAGHRYMRYSRELKTRSNEDGYILVSLSKNNSAKPYRVHRLIYEAFVGPIPDGMIIRHLNDVKNDNRLENLKVGTHTDNRHDSVRNGTHFHANLTHCPKGHPYDEENTRYTKTGHRRYCLKCHNEKAQAWKNANREKVRAANREYMREYNRRPKAS